jgi:hypothetical protein
LWEKQKRKKESLHYYVNSSTATTDHICMDSERIWT